jgi:oxygen-dependent protoporphyrinogen oxidase
VSSNPSGGNAIINRPLIIGGGISGLAAAYFLAKQGRPSLLLEPGRLGGVIQTKRLEGCLLEEGPDSFLSAKPEALDLIRELGLESEVIGSNDHQRVTWIWREGRMVPLPDGLMMMVPTKVMPMALSPLVGWGTKLRMGWEFFRAPQPGLPDRSVGEFIEDHYGKEAVDYLAEPLLSGVYGGDPYKLSVQSVLPRFAEMEAKYGSLTKGTLAGMAKASKPPAEQQRQGGSATLFRTLRGGLATLVEALRAAIAPHCEHVRTAARHVELEGKHYRVQSGDQSWLSSQVIVATPAWSAARLLVTLDPRLAGMLARIEYSSSLTAGLVYERAQVRQAFPAFGFLVPRKERRHLVACTFVDQKFDHRVPADKLLLRCFLGGAGQDHVLDWSDEDVIAAIREDLAAMLGLRAEPVATSVSRWPDSMAQYEVGHAKTIEEIRATLRRYPGLRLAGNGYAGIGIPDCIRSAKLAVQSLLEQQTAA